MNLLKLRKYWQLTCSFVKAHWRGLVVGAAMLLCFFYGKKVEKKMKLDRAMALAQWDKDKKQIETIVELLENSINIQKSYFQKQKEYSF